MLIVTAYYILQDNARFQSACLKKKNDFSRLQFCRFTGRLKEIYWPIFSNRAT
jgi:CRISPR/Cas system-associated endoribonuclease Cas2